MTNGLVKSVLAIWGEWDLRSFVLLSLLVQFILTLVAPFRKVTKNTVVVVLIWVSYQLADWIASYGIGLMIHSKNKAVLCKCVCGTNSTTTTSSSSCGKYGNIQAFWAPFLLLHLGGPDSITALNLADNELWMRSALQLVAQAYATLRVFLQYSDTLAQQNMWIPITLIFIVGVIKYVERVLSLFNAQLEKFRDSLKASGTERWTVRNSTDGQQVEELSDLQLMRDANYFFENFKGLFADATLRCTDGLGSRLYFLRRKPEDAFRMLEMELNFAYQVFYTKTKVTCQAKGYYVRFACFLMELAALDMWVFMDKHDFQKSDIWITYILLTGAIVLEIISFWMILLSDHMFVRVGGNPCYSFLVSVWDKLLSFRWMTTCKGDSSQQHNKRCILLRRWSESIPQFNLMNLCVNRRHPIIDRCYKALGVKDMLDGNRYVSSKCFTTSLRDFIFEELRRKSESHDLFDSSSIHLARGTLIFQHYQRSDSFTSNAKHRLRNICKEWIEDVQYDESLLMWHMATEICYYNLDDRNYPHHHDEGEKCNRRISKILSHYMLYLLIQNPIMMPLVAGFSQTDFWFAYQDTCDEARELFRTPRFESMIHHYRITGTKDRATRKRRIKIACMMLVGETRYTVPLQYRKSLFTNATTLAYDLLYLARREEIKIWELIGKLWVELLCYAAINCRPNSHTSQLTKGGELLTLTWLLTTHFGLGKPYRKVL